MKKEKVILVNKFDKKIGVEEKLKAHVEGKLHRAFSVFLFDKNGKILIQKRAKKKYHSGGLWANSCCSHPREGESLKEAVKRRLKEELGVGVKNLKKLGKVKYKLKVGKLIENEIDHVFVGKIYGKVKINKNEVEDYKWVEFKDLKKDLKKNEKKYVPWLKFIIKKLKN
jgi:isopentenyl-diphosphate delta-isomerase